MTKQQRFICRNDIVLIKPDDAETTSSGGIVLAGAGHAHPIGLVIAVGPGALNQYGDRVEIGLEVGEAVYYRPDAKMYTVELEGHDLIAMREHDILGVYEEYESEDGEELAGH